MRERSLFPAALCLLLATGLMAQPKFRNGRFANITPVAVSLVDAAEFFSDPVFDAVGDELANAFKADDLKFVRSKTTEAMLPPALNSFNKREENRKFMLDYKLYELARFDAAGLVVCIAPISENQHMKDRNMIGADDLILVFTPKAFAAQAEVEAEDEGDYEDYGDAGDEIIVRPDIDYSKVKTRNLAEVIRLKMPDGTGTNGAAVAFHPDLEMYFATFAGNMAYPLAVFDKKGKRISSDDQTIGFDPRGLWYDSKKGQIWGNGYSDFGWYKLDVSKKPAAPEPKSIEDGQLQPGENSVGAYDAIGQGIAFFDPGNTEVRIYDTEKMEEKDLIALHPGITDPKIAAEHTLHQVPVGYNQTTALALGGRKTAFGLIHVSDRQVECYDRSTGMLTEVWKLPTAGFAVPDNFNAAYANGTVFLFDMEKRTWVGYR